MSRIHLIEYAGKTQSIKDWAKELDINYVTLLQRLNVSKWPVKRAFTEPIGMPGKISNGLKGKELVRLKLLSSAKLTANPPLSRGHDMVANGARIAVKYALPNKLFQWQFNIHRHGRLNEDGVDFYIFCLDGVPGGKPLYVVLPAPVGVKQVEFTIHTLIKRYARDVENWDLLKNFRK